MHESILSKETLSISIGLPKINSAGGAGEVEFGRGERVLGYNMTGRELKR